jgi:hypothetical protein
LPLQEKNLVEVFTQTNNQPPANSVSFSQSEIVIVGASRDRDSNEPLIFSTKTLHFVRAQYSSRSIQVKLWRVVSIDSSS